MEAFVVRITSFVVISLLASACSRPKQTATVFPETSSLCQQTAHPERYIVKKENGEILVHYAKSREDMIQNYVEPNLAEIAFVEQDQKLSKLDVTRIQADSLETWGTTRIQASYAWNLNIYGQNTVVAVIDSGVDISHEALAGNIYVNELEANGQPGVDDDSNGLIDDISGWNFDKNSADNLDEDGHGTHVAGIIAALHISPVKGVAPKTKIIPLDFMNEHGGFASNGILSIRYAVEKGARVINASWGSNSCSSLLKKEIQDLEQKNVLFVAAAGNSGNNLSLYPEFPAAYINPTQITVSALTVRGFMAWFTNYGRLSNIMAPGEKILSSVPGNKYEYLNGTSMAAPMVSGVAALLFSHNPHLTALQAKQILLQSATKGPFDVSSRGELNVPAALSLAR
jgi:subtilisin family serine protease